MRMTNDMKFGMKINTYMYVFSLFLVEIKHPNNIEKGFLKQMFHVARETAN